MRLLLQMCNSACNAFNYAHLIRTCNISPKQCCHLFATCLKSRQMVLAFTWHENWPRPCNKVYQSIPGNAFSLPFVQLNTISTIVCTSTTYVSSSEMIILLVCIVFCCVVAVLTHPCVHVRMRVLAEVKLCRLALSFARIYIALCSFAILQEIFAAFCRHVAFGATF